MERTLEWINEEEGNISFYDGEKTKISFCFFRISEEEAELKLAGLEIEDTIQKIEMIQDEIISKVIKSVIGSFELLWEEGFEETVLVEQKGTGFWKILSSTKVVKKSYSEYMMQRILRSGEIVAHNSHNLVIRKEEDGLVCENKEKSFFCHLLPYEHQKETGDRFYLYEVMVSEEKRNQGIAYRCLMELFGRLSEQKPVTIVLQAGSYNEPAVHLYKKLGFQVQEELCFYTVAEE